MPDINKIIIILTFIKGYISLGPRINHLWKQIKILLPLNSLDFVYWKFNNSREIWKFVLTTWMSNQYWVTYIHITHTHTKTHVYRTGHIYVCKYMFIVQIYAIPKHTPLEIFIIE